MPNFYWYCYFFYHCCTAATTKFPSWGSIKVYLILSYLILSYLYTFFFICRALLLCCMSHVLRNHSPSETLRNNVVISTCRVFITCLAWILCVTLCLFYMFFIVCFIFQCRNVSWNIVTQDLFLHFSRSKRSLFKSWATPAVQKVQLGIIPTKLDGELLN